ncbi:Melanoma antigen preferentially expressed in tumors [Heterocephalus glaber]|uniref:Melanoma antigen preferentially expressed in tumors n=1 Tax=Heterocephalus glaber TaxID=10181 RepID=G5C6C6_HETGA|nr:melanoma antigen preferentially expressed in tumors [Heterocephalus glaber]XP_021112695.1 melanoma antigen preferentially expressed in tumors [Heterocephalus glaber]EHB17087.1 Melanoma antigen preferentially expressed in tumors [Heterocephalus glaber]
MTMLTPPTLLELAKQSLLRDEALVIGSLEELPIELFPPLFMAAYARRYSKTLKAMVQAWPFPCLPLGPLMTEQELHQENFQAALSGLDALLSQEVRPRRWNLQVLDLRTNVHQDFWTVWSGTRMDVWSLIELEAAQPMKKKQKVGSFETQAEQSLGPVKVLLDLCLKQGRKNKLLTSLMKKVKKKKGLLHLCCKKLKIFAMPIQNIKMILKMVQLDSVQDLEINCTWKMSTFGMFAPYLGQMSNIQRLLLSHILTSCTYLEKEEQYVSQFTSQFLSFHHLQKLYLDSVSFLKGHFNKVLRCLKSSLEILSITNCLLSESDLMHLSQCPNMSQLKDLSLSGVNLTTMSPEPLRALLERASSTLEDLDLDECGIMDPQFIAILPGLSKCSQLTTFTFCGNSISMGVLQNLLLHTIGLSKLNHVLYPAPLETYEDNPGILHLGKLAHLHAKLKQMLHDAGRQAVVWFSANLCPHCGDKTLYDPEPILCSCYIPL